jgi:hypothetical protein
MHDACASVASMWERSQPIDPKTADRIVGGRFRSAEHDGLGQADIEWHNVHGEHALLPTKHAISLVWLVGFRDAARMLTTPSVDETQSSKWEPRDGDVAERKLAIDIPPAERQH